MKIITKLSKWLKLLLFVFVYPEVRNTAKHILIEIKKDKVKNGGIRK